MTENNEIPPYQRLDWSVTDGKECLKLYIVWYGKERPKAHYGVVIVTGMPKS